MLTYKQRSLGGIFFCIVIAFCLLASSVYAQGDRFIFTSGGAYHPEGFGEWTVRLGSEGIFSITHDVRGKIKCFGTFSLTEKESQSLWELVYSINIEQLESSQRSGVPDEIQYAFMFTDEVDFYAVNIWVNDARKNKNIASLVDYIAILIEQYAKEKPVF
ncbi:hypothetical protein ACFL1E_02770 [Candidatus Omnitrophota bacterium]